MGNFRRIYANGAVEHRADEDQLGAAAYTEDNVPEPYRGLAWEVRDIVANPLPEPSPRPDRDGFIEEGLATMGRQRSNELMRNYPIFLRALERGNWPLVRATLADALADGVLIQQEHDTLAGLLDEYHIPES